MLHDLHAQFAQVLITVLLEYGGYRVVRLGAEELVPEVKGLQTMGAHLRLEPRLAALPDLLVIDQQTATSRMLEVKFRREFSDSTTRSLHAAFTRLFDLWPDAFGVIVTAAPPVHPSSRYQEHIRVIRPEDLEGFGSSDELSKRWLRLPVLGSTFPRVHDAAGFHSSADQAVAGLRTWLGVAPAAPASH